jgi:hypothetical protein
MRASSDDDEDLTLVRSIRDNLNHINKVSLVPDLHVAAV